MSYASSAIKRLSNEYRHIQKVENRVSDYFVAPLEENIFEWHFTLRGPAGDDKSLPYKDGLYHGALIFSRSYPLEPPDIMFFTRSGRFATHEKICSTISSYHKELWQPTYDVALTLSALRHFMAQEDEFGVGAFPKNMVAAETKLAWAKETWSFKCATCGRGTQEVWETEMKMYPETSLEKEALVPKLPPAASAASSAAAAVTAAETSAEPAGDTTGTKEDGKAAAAEESAAAAAAASPAVPTPAPSADDARFQSGEKEKSKVEEVMPDISANAATVSLPAQGPLEPKDAGAAGGLAAETTGPRSPRSPTLSPAAPARRRKVEDTSFEPNDSAGHDFPEEECERHTEGVEHTLPYLWQHSEGARDSQPEYSYEVDDDDYDEDGVPRRCFLTSLPLLNDEEARQLEMADASSGIPNMRFEPVLQAAIRREAREKAAAAAAAAGLPPQPSPPASPSPEMLYAELAEVLAQGFTNEVDADDSAAAPVNVEEQQPQPTPPQQQLAENAVFGIHTYRVSIPLRYIDRAIIWSFSLIVLILARRAGWAMLSALWSAS